jgi:hypothetical protein
MLKTHSAMELNTMNLHSVFRRSMVVVCAFALVGLVSDRPFDLARAEQPNRDTNEPARGVACNSGLDCIGRLDPRSSEQIDSSRWGVSCNWIADKRALPVEKQIEHLAWLGVKWALLCPDWDRIEVRKGRYDWNTEVHRFDDVIAGLRARKIAPVIQIYGGNRLYMPLAPDPNNRPLADATRLLDDPEVRGAWHRFIGAMVERYRKDVKVWEIWNEPNSTMFWKAETSPAQYGRIVKDVAAIIRSRDPQAVILAGATAGVPASFAESLLVSDGASSFDHWSVHPYGELPEGQDDPIRTVQELLRSKGKSPLVWQSECGFPSSAETAGWGFGGPWDEIKHAKWLLRRLLCDVALGAPVAIYYVLNDYPAALEGGPNRGKMGMNRKGLFTAESWRPKAAAHAYRHLTGLIDDRCRFTASSLHWEIVKRGSFETPSSGRIRSLTAVDKAGRPLIVYWLAAPMQTDTIPGTVRLQVAADVAPKNPVLVDLLDGRIYAANSRRGGNAVTFEGLPLADSPLVLCDRAIVGSFHK